MKNFEQVGSLAAWGESEPHLLWTEGPWSARISSEEVAKICYLDRLVLRSVRLVARDRDWLSLRNSHMVIKENEGLVLSFQMEGPAAALQATLTIHAGEQLTLVGNVTALTPFERNRVGLTVLHPPEVAGTDFDITDTSGRVSQGTFPVLPSPHQPATDIASIRWESEGVRSEITFSGEVFEMEDHRNWTDASFKIYGTPLHLPFPVSMNEGDTVVQTVTLSSKVLEPQRPSAPHSTITLERTELNAPEVSLGLASAPDSNRAAGVHRDPLVLVEMDLEGPNWRAIAERAIATANHLDVRLIASDPASVDMALTELETASIRRIGVFDPESHVTEPQVWEALCQAIADRKLTIERIAGTRAHFTELNRHAHRVPEDADGIAFSITPQMHSQTTDQILESVPFHGLVTQAASGLFSGKRIHVGPITLRPRFNAVATNPSPQERPDLALGFGAALQYDATDPRQESTGLAAWTVASYIELLMAGAQSVALFEQWGPRGVRDTNGQLLPVGEAVTTLETLAGQPVHTVTGLPHGISLVGFEQDAGLMLLGANLTVKDVLLPVQSTESKNYIHIGSMEWIFKPWEGEPG